MSLIKYLKKIDIVNLNYSHSYYSNYQGRTKNKPFYISLLSGGYAVISFAIKQIVKDFFSIFRNKKLKNKHLLFYTSINQYNALQPLKENLPDSTFISVSVNSENRLPMGIGCLFSFLLLPRFLSIFNKKNSGQKRIMLQFLPFYFFIEGTVLWWSFYLKWIRPKSIIVSNDHLVWQRVLCFVAQNYHIPTIYIQHASVVEDFPGLIFDLSLLEGKDALNKYQQIGGIKGKVDLVGMIKFDKYYKNVNASSSLNSIGICTNLLDEELYIEKLCLEIKSCFSQYSIILRPHPQDKRIRFYNLLKKNFNIELSDSRIENSFEFLKKVDVIVAGDTSIHLEAVLMNVYPIYFQLSKKRVDPYGYIKNGLITDCYDNIEDLINRLLLLRKTKPNIRYRAKYYVDTVGGKYDGRSVDKAVLLINQIVKEYGHH